MNGERCPGRQTIAILNEFYRVAFRKKVYRSNVGGWWRRETWQIADKSNYDHGDYLPPSDVAGVRLRKTKRKSKWATAMYYRIGIFLLVVVALAILWSSKIRTALGFVGLIAVLAAIGLLVVVLINLPAPQ
jgi:small-conductance mechanosensitive channel